MSTEILQVIQSILDLCICIISFIFYCTFTTLSKPVITLKQFLILLLVLVILVIMYMTIYYFYNITMFNI